MHLISTIARAKVYIDRAVSEHTIIDYSIFCTIIKYQSNVKSSFTSLLHVLLRFCIIILFEIGAFMHWIYINLIMWLWLRKTWDMGLWIYNCLINIIMREVLFSGLYIIIRWLFVISLLKISKFFSFVIYFVQ